MIDDPNRFNADKSPYERPACKFRCGRSAGWGTACSKGPSLKGKCGGEYECSPIKKGDRYECTRPMRAGGPCEHGARPDGACPNHRPPCVPKKSLREMRGRIVLMFLVFLLALIALTSTFVEAPGAFKNMMVNAGGLSELHEGFTHLGDSAYAVTPEAFEQFEQILPATVLAKLQPIQGNQYQTRDAFVVALQQMMGEGESGRYEQKILKIAEKSNGKGCEFCHDTYGDRMHGWLKAAFTSHDVSKNCLQCHAFGEHDQTTHNMVWPNETYPNSPDLGALACTKCHTEHKGKDHDMRALTNAQCASCHQKKFTIFPDEHPEYADNFPYQIPNTIRFNHNRHLEKHFSDAKFKDKAPSCTNCHEVSSATREVKPKPYEEVCSQCHAKQIVDSELVLFELPVLAKTHVTFAAAEGDEAAESDEEAEETDDGEEADDDNAKIDLAALCGMTAEQQTNALEGIQAMAEDGVDGSVANSEEVTPLMAYLLNVTSDDIEEYAEPMQTLLGQMATLGVAAFIEKLKESEGFNPLLLSGLAPEQVQQAACAWIANVEYGLPDDVSEAMEDVDLSGWRADGLALKYRPAGHADPVVRAWIEYLVKRRTETDDEDIKEKLDATFEAFVDRKEGAGKCAKCHALATPEKWSKDYAKSMWTYEAQTERPHTHFKHGPHINLLAKDSCKTCHKLDKTVKYDAYFKGIDLDPKKYISNFKPISKNTCGQCHQEGIVSIDCQVCHSYHEAPRMRANIKELVQKMK